MKNLGKIKSRRGAIAISGAVIVVMILVASYASVADESVDTKNLSATSNIPHLIWGYAQYSGDSWAVGASVSVHSSLGTLSTTVLSDGAWQVDCGDPGPNWADGTSFTVTITQNSGETYQGWSGSASGTVSGNQNNMGTINLNPPSPPNKPSKPSGPTSGDINTAYTYSTSTTDPNGIDVKYGWDWGDGSSIEWSGWLSSGQTCNMDHKWTSKGSYDVKVKAMNKGSQESVFSSALTVVIGMNPPTAYIDSINPNPAWEGESVSFSGHGDDSDGTIVAYNWRSNIDGTLSDQSSFSTSSLSVGTHTIYFKVEDNDGLWSGEDTKTLVIQSTNNPPNTPTKPSGPTTGNTGTSYSYSTSTIDPDGDKVKYYFDWGDGTGGWTSLVDSGTAGTKSHSWSSAGNYEIKVKAKDEDGAESGWSAALQITISEPGGNHPPNTPTTPSGPTSGNVNESYSYSTSATDPDYDEVQYIFDWGDGTSSNWTTLVSSGISASMSHIWSSEGIYNVTARARDENGATSWWSSELVVNIGVGNRPPNTPERPTGEQNGSTGVSYTYATSATDPDGDDLLYMWDWGDGNHSDWYNSPSASHRWSSQGSYSVRVKVKDIRDDPSEELESDWSEPLVVSMPKIFSLPPFLEPLERILSFLGHQPLFKILFDILNEYQPHGCNWV